MSARLDAYPQIAAQFDVAGATAAWSFFNAASFASCRQAKEIAGFGYSDSAPTAYDLEIFAAERAGDAKLVA